MNAAFNGRIAVALGAVLAVLATLAPPPAGAADASARVPTVTRAVKLFLEREAALADAIRSADAATLDKSLADDFELRAGAQAGRPVPRADFVRNVLRSRESGGEMAAMAVHDLGDVAVVSFTQGNRGGPLFVVDVWRKQGSEWQDSAIRYASPAGTATYAIPGVGADTPEIPKKY